MLRKSFIKTGLALVMLSSLILSACAQPAQPGASQTQAQGEAVTIRMALLPILDTLPMYVAQQENLFAKHGVKVELIPVRSAPERDQLISTGQADGMINEIVSTIFYNKDKIQVQIVRFARTATPEAPLFRILASGKSDIKSVNDLKGVPIGVSEGTVIEYLTYRLLKEEGFSDDEIKTVAVPDISARMALLGTGELKAAMLPEPLSSLGVQQGARVILDDSSHPEFSYSTIAFRKTFIDQNPQAVRRFLAAIEDATAMINADPSKYSNLLSKQQLVPKPLEGSFDVPKFVTASVPNEAQWNDVASWAKSKGLLDKEVSYSQSVDASYLP
jgi:NitT/TauT family transport system substrate-binding protein